MGGTYMDMLFNAAALYAATLIIYGMLAIHETKFSHRKRSLTSMYGTPIPEKTEIPTNAFGRARVFAKHFFLRPSFITGVVMGVLVIRNYANPFTSCTLAFGLSAVILSEVRHYETKFLPICSVLVGVAFGVAHLLGYMYDWHTLPLGPVASVASAALHTEL